ncbi:MAG: hypothetical protein CMM94_05555 [Rickettsiales bacterium]|nr:hypothetical protein [Rickettsiales bacterium]
MARISTKLCVEMPDGNAGYEPLCRMISQWVAHTANAAPASIQFDEIDHYYHSASPDIIIKERQYRHDGNAAMPPWLAPGMRQNMQLLARKDRNGEGYVMREDGTPRLFGALIMQRREMLDGDNAQLNNAGHNQVLHCLTREEADGVSHILADGLPFDITVEKTRAQIFSGKGWHVNIDRLSDRHRPGAEGELYIELQQDVPDTLDASQRKHYVGQQEQLLKSMADTLQERCPAISISHEPRSYRDIARERAQHAPVIKAQSGSWLRMATRRQIDSLKQTPNVVAPRKILDLGAHAERDAFLVSSGQVDIYVKGHFVRSVQAGEVFGDIGPMAGEMGMVKLHNETLRFGSAYATPGTTVVPISREMLRSMCQNGQLNGYVDLVRERVKAWKSALSPDQASAVAV